MDPTPEVLAHTIPFSDFFRSIVSGEHNALTAAQGFGNELGMDIAGFSGPDPMTA